MANHLKGEVTLKHGERTYTLVYSVDALVALEDRLDLDVVAIGAMAKKRMGRLGFLRPLFWAGLLDRQPDMTEKEAGDLILEFGMGDVILKVSAALQRAFPTAKEAAGDDQAPADPPPPPPPEESQADGIGTTS